MDHKLLLIILLSGFYIPSCCVLREYHFVNLKMTWNEARSYCREKYTDLATVENMEDVKSLKAVITTDNPGTYTWFGLHDDPTSWKGTIGHDVNSWRWSAADAPIRAEYHNWRSDEPNYNKASQLCVIVGDNSYWHDADCGEKKYFVCYDVQQTFILVEIELSWKAAQQHCRHHYTDLAVVKYGLENNQVASLLSPHQRAWIGLHRVAWTWSDQTNLSFTHWAENQPNNSQKKQHCGAVNLLEQFKWADVECVTKLEFFCHRAVQEVKVMRMKIQTDADLTDPHINDQLLQQLREALAKQGVTNFRLRWKNSTHKAGEL